MKLEINGVKWEATKDANVKGGQIRHNPVFGTVRVVVPRKQNSGFRIRRYNPNTGQIETLTSGNKPNKQDAGIIEATYPYVLIKKL